MARKMRDIGVAAGKIFHAEAQRGRGAEKMKPSGIPWIGDIPEGWRVMKLKGVLARPLQYGASESGVGYDKALPRYIRITDITLDGKLKDEGALSLTEESALDYILQDQDILLARSGATVGKAFLYEKQMGRAAFAGYLIRATIDVAKALPRFVYYTTLGCGYDDWRNSIAVSATIQNIGADKYNTYSLPIPSIEEQKAIADYLDEKCAAIDAAVTEAKKGIEEYKVWKKSLIFEMVTGKRRVGAFNAETQSRRDAEKMKPSGIPWIGDIPEGWRVSRVKNIADIQHGQDPKTEGSIPVYGSGDGSFKTCGEYKDGPAVLLGRKGATLHIPHYIVGRYWNVDTAFDVKMLGDANLRWFFYLAICFDYKAYMSQTTLPSMTQSDYRNMTIPIPEVSEQQAIADYLDEKCAAIDAMVAEKEALIADLEAYKKSLIFEVVTGKREVA